MGSLILLTLLAIGAASPAQPEVEAPPAIVKVSAPTGAGWVGIIPADWKARSRTFEVEPGRKEVRLEGIRPGFALVCAGGEELATSCAFRELEAGSVLPLPALTPGVRLTGSVLRGRRPAAGAEVGLAPHPVPLRRTFVFPLSRKAGAYTVKVESDERGRYVLPHVAPGTYRLDLRFPGGRLFQGEPFTVPDPEILRRRQKPTPGDDPGRPPTLELGETSVGDGVEIAVTAVDTAGRPLPGARVVVGQGDPVKGQVFEAMADADGRAKLAGLTPGEETKLICRQTGFVRSEQGLGSGPPANARCVLELFTRVEGRVFDLDDRPLPGARVSVKPRRETLAVDGEGRYTVQGLSPGAHTLVVAAPGFRSFTTRLKLAPEQELKLPPIRLQAALGFAGRVVDGSDGEPVAGAVVTITDPPGAGMATTDDEGLFTLKADAEGDLLLAIGSARHPTTPFAVSALDRKREEGEPRTYEVQRGGRIHAVVWDPEAEAPCAGCTINMWWNNPLGNRGFSATTNSRGESLSEPLPPGRYHVSEERAVSTGSSISVGPGPASGAVAEVLPGETTTVHLGKKRERPTLEVVFLPPPAPATLLRLLAAGEDVTAQLGDGGVYRLGREPGKGGRLSLHFGRTGDLDVLQAVLPEGFDEPYLRLPLASTSVRGVLVAGSASAPVGAANRVEVVSQADGTLFAFGVPTEAGGFSATYLPVGSYVLRVDGRVLQSFVLTEGQPLDLGSVEIPGPTENRLR